MNQDKINKIIAFLVKINKQCVEQKSAKKSIHSSSYFIDSSRDGYRDDFVDQWGHS